MGSFFTMALFFTILITPRASVTVTTIGSPSGMAATARLRETRAKPVGNDQHHVYVVSFERCVVCLQSPDSDGEHVQDPLPLEPPHQHDDP